jgi:N-acetylneuraminate lyase
MELKGIFTALLTPFDANNKINEEALVQLVKHNLKLGVQGFYVGGSTAEAFLLTTEERKQVMRIVKAAAGDAKLIAHIGSISEDEAIELSLVAKELGYDAISSVAPFYYKFSFEDIKKYYYNIADAAGIPMLVYHFPAFSGVNMGVNEMSAFLNDDRFAGIKYTSNDFFTMEQCKSRFPNKVVYNGFDEMFMAGIAMGADGGIGSTYNFMADKFVKIQKLFSENKIAEAQEIQREANRIITILCKVGVMQAEKEVLNQLGLDFGECRRPFIAPTAEQKELIAKEIVPFVKKID